LQTVAHHLGHVVAPLVPRPVVVQPAQSIAVDPADTIRSSLTNYPGMKTIIEEFVEGLPAEVDKLLDLVNQQDLLPLRRVAHQLRGTGGGYGFEAITELAAKVEDSIKASADRESIGAQIQSLIEVIRRVEGFTGSNRKTPNKMVLIAAISSNHN